MAQKNQTALLTNLARIAPYVAIAATSGRKGQNQLPPVDDTFTKSSTGRAHRLPSTDYPQRTRMDVALGGDLPPEPTFAEMPLTPADILGLMRMSAKGVRTLAKELETGRGGLAQMVKQSPDLQKASQQAARVQFGETIPSFRAISPTGALRPDKVASTTTDPKVALQIARDFPVLMAKDDFIAPKPILRRYDVSPDRVQAHVPALIDAARAQQPHTVRTGKIDTRLGDRMSIDEVFEQARAEDELLSDLLGLNPQEVAFQTGAGQPRRASRALDVATGKFTTGADEVQKAKKSSSFFEDEGLAAQEFDAFAQEILKLLAP
jgi:hypothetical protein|tara:strand:- start:444 stop:1406 length:963 start_codon:yes stop_codon:yes gene_type:complete